MQISYKTPLWFYPKPIDFRKQIDGLVLLIADALDKVPTSGELFVFRSRDGRKLKLLWYDQQGFWLCYKRLEKGKFKLSDKHLDVLELTRDELSWLLTGLDFKEQKQLPTVSAERFF